MARLGPFHFLCQVGVRDGREDRLTNGAGLSREQLVRFSGNGMMSQNTVCTLLVVPRDPQNMIMQHHSQQSRNILNRSILAVVFDMVAQF